jgi:transposase
MDLSRFNEHYRVGGAGRAPYDPQVMVALLLYAYARGNRSSRGIEGGCREDVAFTGDHEHAHAEPLNDRGVSPPPSGRDRRALDDVLGLCREAGLVSVEVITIDGSKIKANASMYSYRGLVREILREAEEIDRREDELFGEHSGDELPEPLRTPDGRRQALADAKRPIEERKGRKVKDGPVAELSADPEAVVLARPGVGVVAGCGSGSWAASSSHIEPRRGGRFRLIGTIAGSRRSLAWRRTTRSSSPPTMRMSAGG